MATIKRYDFNYDMYEMEACFEVDTDKFTADHAKATLEFFTWNYDKEADPIDEVMKKYAIVAMNIATQEDYNEYGVISEFNDKEGFCKIDGSSGIKLISISGFEIEEHLLEMTIETTENTKEEK